MKIRNLYKDLTMLNLFKRVYCLEKIHGTSAHLRFQHGSEAESPLTYFSGGSKLESFKELFDHEALLDRWSKFDATDLIIFGEVYGGKIQRMSSVYGPDLRFVVFEVKIGECFLSVPDAADVAESFGLEFVHYREVEATAEAVNAERDLPSTQARRNGLGDDKWSEGVVIRPLVELRTNNGARLIAKHKRPEFRETKSVRRLSPENKLRLERSQSVAEEYVVEERLHHVMDRLIAARIAADPLCDPALSLKDTGSVVREMIKDVKTEEGDEIEWSQAVAKAIGARAAFLFKEHIRSI